MRTGRLPLYFVENRGQFTDRVKFYVKTFGQTLYFTDEGIVFDFVRPIKESGAGAKSGKFSYGFQVASFDTSCPLIIDPTLSYATYLGGSNQDAVHGIALESWADSQRMPALMIS